MHARLTDHIMISKTKCQNIEKSLRSAFNYMISCMVSCETDEGKVYGLKTLPVHRIKENVYEGEITMANPVILDSIRK